MKKQSLVIAIICFVIAAICIVFLMRCEPDCPTCPYPPNTPANFEIVAEFDYCRITWEDVDREGFYVLVRNGEIIANLTESTTSYIDSNLAIGTYYIYAFWAENEFGKSNTITTPITTKGRFIATWDENDEPDVVGYRLYIVMDTDTVEMYDGPANNVEFLADHDPCCIVRAYDSQYVSGPSDVACVND